MAFFLYLSSVITLALVPTLPMIEDLREGNVLWSPAQLSSMTAQTYRDGASILGEIRSYTTEQLIALRDKAIEVHTPDPANTARDQSAFIQNITLHIPYKKKKIILKSHFRCLCIFQIRSCLQVIVLRICNSIHLEINMLLNKSYRMFLRYFAGMGRYIDA